MVKKSTKSRSSADHAAISASASVLRVTEFRLFELAYLDWFGQSSKEADIERVYIPYLIEGVAPCWVRQYTRQVLRLCEDAGVSHGLADWENLAPKSRTEKFLLTLYSVAMLVYASLFLQMF